MIVCSKKFIGLHTIKPVPNFANFHGTTGLSKIVPFKLSDIGEGIREVIIKEWHVNVGDVVHEFDPICEVQSDKATATITSRFDGTIKALHYELNQACLVGNALVDIEIMHSSPTENAQPTFAATQESNVPSKKDILSSSAKFLATPSVRRIASENQIELSQVPGTGRDGRVLKEDILAYLDQKERGPPIRSETRDAPQSKTVPLTAIQKVMCSTMTRSNAIPHFVLSDELDLTQLVQVRKEIAPWIADRYALKLTYMPFFIKAASMALLQYPILNAQVDENVQNIIYKKSHNIGLAMDTPEGLLVPNVKSVQDLSIIDVARELTRMQNLALQSKLGPSDLTGGTMTLSNIGSIGGTYTSPRLLPPELLIGGIGRIQLVPRFDSDGAVRRAHIMNVSWAADHRVIDGATVANFSKLWQSYLEDPVKLMVQLK